MTGVLMKSEEKPRIFCAGSCFYKNIRSVQSYIHMMLNKKYAVRVLILVK